MVIVGLLVGLVIGLLAAGFMVSVIMKFAQVIFLAITRIAISIFCNVVILISVVAALGIVGVFGNETSPWLLLLAPIIGIIGTLAFMGSVAKEIAGAFGSNRENGKTNGN